jgi:ribosomal protein S18 acetylase RimI-like enzyme
MYNVVMDIIASNNEFVIKKLSKELAEQYADDICNALDQIPLTEKHTKKKLLADKKGERILYDKWNHSLIAFDKEQQFAGVIIGYERASEENDLYPSHSIYLNDLAVSKHFQKRGLGKLLVTEWITYNKELGFTALEGDVRFSVQTNKDEWNTHVQQLYESIGFKKIAEKEYENRTDNVYSLYLN